MRFVQSRQKKKVIFSMIGHAYSCISMHNDVCKSIYHQAYPTSPYQTSRSRFSAYPRLLALMMHHSLATCMWMLTSLPEQKWSKYETWKFCMFHSCWAPTISPHFSATVKRDIFDKWSFRCFAILVFLLKINLTVIFERTHKTCYRTNN